MLITGDLVVVFYIFMLLLRPSKFTHVYRVSMLITKLIAKLMETLIALLRAMLVVMLCENIIKVCGNCKKGLGLQRRGYKSHFIDLRLLQDCLHAVHRDSERTLNGLANT